MKQIQRISVVLRPSFWLYALIFLTLFLGLGEWFSRKLDRHFNLVPNYDPLSETGYTPASYQFQRLNEYVNKVGPPECIIFGNSYVEHGIDPATFSTAFQSSSGKKMDCYNFGMSGSTMSSTVPMAMIVIKTFKPSYIIIGVQATSFTYHSTSYLTEGSFQNFSWVRYKQGKFDPVGWMIDQSVLYRVLRLGATWMFPEGSQPPPQAVSSIPDPHPDVPWKITAAGFGPLIGYRSESPIFKSSGAPINPSDVSLDSQDYAAFIQMLDFARQSNLRLILVEMPSYSHPAVYQAIINQVVTVSRQHAVPFLSTDFLSSLPASAYSDQTHLQVSGAEEFSQWLGVQLGKAESGGTFLDLNSPVWSPVLSAWPVPAYLPTLGLSESSYNNYRGSLSKFDLFPLDALLFNPDLHGFDKQFLQSSLGFDIDWKEGLSLQDQKNLYQFMVVLAEMHYQDDLQLSPTQTVLLEQWRANPDPSILKALGIQYILCRVELADPSIQHCPVGLGDAPGYQAVASWNFDPTNEKYFLYKVILSK